MVIFQYSQPSLFWDSLYDKIEDLNGTNYYLEMRQVIQECCAVRLLY